MNDTVYFLCDGKKCSPEKCRGSECVHTSDPRHAKNFKERHIEDITIFIEKTDEEHLPENGTFVM